MKVTTKVAAGAGLLVALLVVALMREMALVRELAQVHRALSEQRFVAVTSTLEILRTLELSEERLLKLFVTRDPAYVAQLERHAAVLRARLDEQSALPLPPEEQHAVEALAASWQAYQDAFEREHRQIPLLPVAERDALRQRLVADVDRVRARAVTLLATLRSGIERDVQRSQQEAEAGERQSWALVALALVSGIGFVWLTMRSLNLPLARLIAATRSVAAGRYARLNATGGDELAELSRAFDTMVERLDEVDRTKRDFLSHVSHELKTPLAAMQETTQVMVEELAGPLTDKQRRLLELNLDAGRRLSSMLSRLLDLSRLEAGAVRYDVRPVDVRQLLASAHQEFEARLSEKGLSASVTLPDRAVRLYGDPDWLIQVFENLMENAIKFSPPQRRLWLELRVVEPHEPLERARTLLQKGPCALVTVADEGPGVPQEAREKIFERFFQVDGRARAGLGVGLGLAICRDIVSAHGGLMWLEEREGGGSIFAVALPLPADLPDENEPGELRLTAANE